MEMENTVFFGNGLNFIDNKDSTLSWENILNAIKQKPFSNGDIPNTLIYEKIILDKVQSSDISVKKEIAEKLENLKSNRVYKLLHESNIQNFITTNYDSAFINDPNSITTETLYSIRRLKKIENKGKATKFLWQIHGEIEKPKTIMLGLNQYCGSIGKIGDYLNGRYEFGKKTEKAMEEKLKTGEFSKTSWIDLFFNTNIHIIGYGLDYSEIDIWWILSWRARRKDKINNKIFFYCKEIKEEKKQLFESLGVLVKEIKTHKKHPDFEFYKKIIDDI
jgi:hypothetical protein